MKGGLSPVSRAREYLVGNLFGLVWVADYWYERGAA